MKEINILRNIRDHIKSRVELQSLNQGLSGNGYQLHVQHLQLPPQKRQGLPSLLADAHIDQGFAFL
jgi:hypothetical protein